MAALPLCASRDPDIWFAGNLIAFSGHNMSPGDFAIQTYYYATRNRGFYDANRHFTADRNVHVYEIEMENMLGLTKHIDTTLELFGFHVSNNGKQVDLFGDLRFFFGFQLLRQEVGTHQPDLRVLLGETFPTGKYQGLDAAFRGADGVGAGAFSNFLNFIASKTYFGAHPFRWTVNLLYTVPGRAHVEGRNVYLDEPSARGDVRPGVEFKADFAFEYKFTQQWEIAGELFFTQQNSSSFHTSERIDFPTDIPSSHNLSIVGNIAYNCSDKLSMLLGAWVSVEGRNTTAFTSFIYSLYYEF